MTASQTSTFDVVVLGSGVASASLALSLALKGRKVAVVTNGPGASGVSSGSWDFGPIPADGSLEACVASARWQSAYEQTLVDWKQIPNSDQLAEAAQSLQRVLAPDLEIALRFDRPWRLPNSHGRFKKTFGAQGIQTGADLAQLEGRSVAVVGSPSWRYRADLLAKSWSENLGEARSVRFIPVDVNYEPKKHRDSSLAHVSARLRDDAECLARFAQATAKAATDYDTVLLPPLSLDGGVAQALRSVLKVPFAECLATVEPNAGHRLHHAIRAAFSRHGVESITSTQVHSSHSEGWLRELSVFTGSGWRALRATNFVLATGKFFGGGLTAEWNGTRESIFGLPLFIDRISPAVAGRPGLDWPRVGVWVDEAFRPQSRPALPAFHNLRACGSILGGVDFPTTGLGLGFMAFTGYQSGTLLT